MKKREAILNVLFITCLYLQVVIAATPPEKQELPENPHESEQIDPTKFKTLEEKVDFFKQRGITLQANFDPKITGGKVKGAENWIELETTVGKIELHFGPSIADQPNAFSGAQLEPGGLRLVDRTFLHTGKMENSGNALKVWNGQLEMENRQIAMNYFLQESRIEVKDTALPEDRRLPISISTKGSEVLYVHRGRDGTIVAQGASEIVTALGGKQAKIVTRMGEITVYGINLPGYASPIRIGDWGANTHATVQVEGIEKYSVYGSSPVTLIDVKESFAAIPYRLCGDPGCIKEFHSEEVSLVSPSRILADVLFTPLQPISKLLIEEVAIRGTIRVQDPQELISHLQIRGTANSEARVVYYSPDFSIGVDENNRLTGAKSAPKMPVEVFYERAERQYLFGLYPYDSKSIFLWRQQYVGEWP